MKTKVTVSERSAPVVIQSTAELEAVISKAAEESRQLGCPNVIVFESENGNSLSLVVGASPATVIGFANGQDNPTYYMSKGDAEAEETVLTATVTLSHRTELSGRWLVPWESGLSATYEFVVSGELPTCLDWVKL